jgi:hypothetical protein
MAMQLTPSTTVASMSLQKKAGKLPKNEQLQKLTGNQHIPNAKIQRWQPPRAEG